MTLENMTADQPCLRAAQALLPALEAAEASSPKRTALSSEEVRALSESGLTAVFRAQAVQGRDVDIPDYLRAIETLARVDASTAWCLQIYNVTNWLISGLFGDDVLETLYRNGSEGLVTGSMAPNGVCLATPTSNGFEVTGKWRFVSGCDHADWIFLKAPLPGQDLPRKHILALAPRAQVRLGDDWLYAGLEATGSKGVEVESLQVLDGFGVPFDDQLLELGVPSERGRTLPHFRLPSRVVMRLPITAVALGVARRALELYEQNINEVRPNGFSPRSLPNFQTRLAESALEIDQAHELLYRTAEDAAARARHGDAFPKLLRARYGRDLVHAVHLCARAVDRLMMVSGARQMFADSPMQAAFRDIHAIACHHSCDRDRTMSNYARVRLNLELNGEEL